MLVVLRYLLTSANMQFMYVLFKSNSIIRFSNSNLFQYLRDFRIHEQTEFGKLLTNCIFGRYSDVPTALTQCFLNSAHSALSQQRSLSAVPTAFTQCCPNSPHSVLSQPVWRIQNVLMRIRIRILLFKLMRIRLWIWIQILLLG